MRKRAPPPEFVQKEKRAGIACWTAWHGNGALAAAVDAGATPNQIARQRTPVASTPVEAFVDVVELRGGCGAAL
jgi:hypothetical protein